MLVGDKTIHMDVTPQIEAGTTYLPLKYIGEGLGYDVNWYKENRIAYLEDSVPYIGIYAQPIVYTKGFALLDEAIRRAGNMANVSQKRSLPETVFYRRDD